MESVHDPYHPASAEFDGEGNVTIHLPSTAVHDLGFPHYRRFVEMTIPRDLYDWDDWHEPSALWVSWRYALEALYQFTRYYSDTKVKAAANPFFGQSAEAILGQMHQQRATAAP